MILKLDVKWRKITFQVELIFCTFKPKVHRNVCGFVRQVMIHRQESIMFYGSMLITIRIFEKMKTKHQF